MTLIAVALVVALLALVLWRLSAVQSEMRRLFAVLAGGLDERLADVEHTAEQARTAANDVRDRE